MTKKGIVAMVQTQPKNQLGTVGLALQLAASKLTQQR